MKKFLIVLLLFFIASCDNIGAKSFGGTMTVELKPNRKLVNATWKDANLWYLTRVMEYGEEAEKYEFKEISNFGTFEGTVIFVETRKMKD